MHESIFKKNAGGSAFAEDEAFRRTFDERTVKALNSVFANNCRQYNEIEKPQKHSLVALNKF